MSSIVTSHGGHRTRIQDHRRCGARAAEPGRHHHDAAGRPVGVLLLLINAYPLVIAALQSVRDGTLIVTGDFVGLANYADVLSSSRFWKAAGFTVIFTLVGVFGSWLVGLGLALLLRTKIPGNTVFKVLVDAALGGADRRLRPPRGTGWSPPRPACCRRWPPVSGSARSTSSPTRPGPRSPSACSKCGSASHS